MERSHLIKLTGQEKTVLARELRRCLDHYHEDVRELQSMLEHIDATSSNLGAPQLVTDLESRIMHLSERRSQVRELLIHLGYEDPTG